MNDFTKEELAHIHEILADACFQWNEPNSTYELRDKIETMIDNYCEHEWVFDEHRGRKVCSKCGLSVWSEK